MGATLFGLIFAAFSCLFMLVGITLARKQAKRLATYRPVPATVLSSEVIAQSGSKGGTTYAPNIRFAYTASGQTLECDTPLPGGKMSSSGKWAQKIVDRYPAGLKTSAYVCPDDAAKAFLVPEPNFFPYIFILFPMIHFSVGLGMLLGGGEPPLLGPARALMVTALVWNAAGIWCMMHYRRAGGVMTRGTTIVLLLYAAVGVIALFLSAGMSNEIPPPTTQPADESEEVEPSTRPADLPPVESP